MRGIILPAGGDYLVGAWIIINLLRTMDCKLPVQIWHQGSDELNWIADVIAARCSGVTFHDIGRAGGARERGGWQLKAEALAATTLDEAMMLDADNQPLMDPTPLFDDPGYKRLGAMFWASYLDIIGDAHGCWKRLGLTPRIIRGIDSSQMIVDRERCSAAVKLAADMNRNSSVWWKDLWGDKDTFPLAWIKSETPYEIAPHLPSLLGRSILHRNRSGQICFRHRFGEKWSLTSDHWETPDVRTLLNCLKGFNTRKGTTEDGKR